MKQALLIVDVQPSFIPPAWQVKAIGDLAPGYLSVATVERHDETVTPFEAQLGWKPAPNDNPLINTDRVFVKHGYCPPAEMIAYFREEGVEQVLVCGIQAETCVLAAGFMLFDAGLRPTLLKWLCVGSSLDVSGELGAKLWSHHFGAASVLTSPYQLGPVKKPARKKSA
ncbi:nicotinamidase-related amidase [Rhizobium sp. SG_E_25_P2]|jgi:nicotinamidase-related amidase|uniref:cysteine hydrolase family protein n=1 Tax=Rhizobium sp. SG_E_25_P2 TaxID=2879942 RepID=UPI002476FD86|nr:cysteine hydrolase family protein [Rhizobium sp. SG_E_25_P2]MDH6269871.1 nicotinamidase-related amidase [Rhizobium sp. SG_E_25_P2]